MKKLITLYKFENPDDTNFRKPLILERFWQAVENKKQEGVEGQPDKVHDDIDAYF